MSRCLSGFSKSFGGDVNALARAFG